LAELGVDLIVWPEAGVYPNRVARPYESAASSGPYQVLKGFPGPLLFGAVSRDTDRAFDYNSAFLLDTSGRVRGAYDKVRLVVFGEYVPFIDPAWLTANVRAIAHTRAGTGPGRFELEATSEHPAMAIGPLICLEDIIPGYVREVAGQSKGVEMFVNLTIDGWYGHRVEPWQHLALARFRAVEHRVPLLRSVSSGVSAIVDFNGRLIAHRPSPEIDLANAYRHPPQILRASLRLPRNTAQLPTPYAQWGWLLPYICQLGVLVQLALTWRRTRIRE
jgi:apolipoprotein N-acyltransferase